jgi:hypothetical protein
MHRCCAFLQRNFFTDIQDFCRVVRFRPDEADDIGHLVRKPGGAWAFRYDAVAIRPMRRVIILALTGSRDCVSVREDDGLHTFQAASVEPV